MTKPCPVCNSQKTQSFMDMPQVPIYCNLLWPSRQAALSAPKGDIQLAYCPECGHVFNAQFDLSLMDYTQDYENSLHFSPRFQAYATTLAKRLIEDHQLYNKQIVDIGSGKGDFMRMLCELGDNRATGFDPSYTPDEIDPDSPVSFIADYYTEKYTSHPADFISCRHVFEHIPEAAEFAQMVRRAVGNRWETAVFFEVPNVLYTLQDLGIWDIIYEHCSYFSPHSLAYAFAHNGFRVHNLDTTFNGQFLTIEAFASADTPTPLPNSINDLTAMTETINAFADNFHHKVNTWQERLAGITASGHKAVIWGAGSKGVTFLNILQTQEQIRHAVDINPRKEGKFVAGTGQEIVTPDFLKTYQPQYVIIMNGNYREEIGRQLEELGLTAEILLA